MMVVALVRSRLDYGYGNVVLVGLPAYLMRQLQSVLNAVARLILRSEIQRPYYILGWLRSTVVRTLVFDRRTFLSHARPAADG